MCGVASAAQTTNEIVSASFALVKMNGAALTMTIGQLAESDTLLDQCRLAVRDANAALASRVAEMKLDHITEVYERVDAEKRLCESKVRLACSDRDGEVAQSEASMGLSMATVVEALMSKADRDVALCQAETDKVKLELKNVMLEMPHAKLDCPINPALNRSNNGVNLTIASNPRPRRAISRPPANFECVGMRPTFERVKQNWAELDAATLAKITDILGEIPEYVPTCPTPMVVGKFIFW